MVYAPEVCAVAGCCRDIDVERFVVYVGDDEFPAELRVNVCPQHRAQFEKKFPNAGIAKGDPDGTQREVR